MNKYELASLIKSLSDLGIISDKRTIAKISAGPFQFKYPVNNILMTTEDVLAVVSDNSGLTKYQLLKKILEDVIRLNETDYFALMNIYFMLAWAAFDEDNEDHFILTQKGIQYNLKQQYDPKLLQENADICKTTVKILPDTNYSCNLCESLKNNQYEIEDFLNNTPIPVKGCSKENGICIALGTVVSSMLF